MNSRELKKTFEAARQDTPPQPSPDFAGNVMRLLPPREARVEINGWDHLGLLLPKIAALTALLIVLCLAVEWWDASANASLADDVSRIALSFGGNPEALDSSL